MKIHSLGNEKYSKRAMELYGYLTTEEITVGLEPHPHTELLVTWSQCVGQTIIDSLTRLLMVAYNNTYQAPHEIAYLKKRKIKVFCNKRERAEESVASKISMSFDHAEEK